MCQQVRKTASVARLATILVGCENSKHYRVLTICCNLLLVRILGRVETGKGCRKYSRKPAVSISHLLKRIVRLEKNIQFL